MQKELKEKRDAVIKALEDLHSDQSGPASDNLEAVEEVIEKATEIKQALEMDVSNAGK